MRVVKPVQGSTSGSVVSYSTHGDTLGSHVQACQLSKEDLIQTTQASIHKAVKATCNTCK